MLDDQQFIHEWISDPLYKAGLNKEFSCVIISPLQPKWGDLLTVNFNTTSEKGIISLYEKFSNIRVFSSPCFYVLGLNTVIYSLNLCIQSEFGKIRTKKTSYLNFSLCNVWNKEALSFRVVSDWKSYNKYFLTFVWVGSWSWEGDLVVFTFEIRNEEGIW